MNKIIKIVWNNKWAGLALAVILLAVWMPLVRSDPASYQSGLAGGVNTEYMNITYLRAPTSAGSTIVIAASDSYNLYHANYQCDGTNDEVQINNAIDNLTYGGTVFLLNGTYHIDTSISIMIDTDDISLKGCGKNTILMPIANAKSEAIITVESADRIELNNFKLYGGGYDNRGIYLLNCSDVIVSYVTILAFSWDEDPDKENGFGIQGSNANHATITNCYVDTFGRNGIHMTHGNYTLITNNHIINATFNNGIGIGGCHVIISNNIITNTYNHGIQHYGEENYRPYDIVINNNELYGTSTGGGGSAICIGYNDVNWNPFSIAIVGNTIDGSGGRGIMLYSNDDDSQYNISQFTITGNMINDTTLKGIDGSENSNCGTVSGNTITNIGNDGMQFDTLCHNITITGNMVRSTSGDGISIGGATYIVSGNLCSNNDDGIYLFNGLLNSFIDGNCALYWRNVGGVRDAGAVNTTITDNKTS